MFPLWVRRLPHNLSTIRPFFFFGVDRLTWCLGVSLHLHLNKGDRDYLFHYERGPYLEFNIGPFTIVVGLTDTPEENAWIL